MHLQLGFGILTIINLFALFANFNLNYLVQDAKCQEMIVYQVIENKL